MSMNIKATKRMRGLMCRSPSVTAACMVNDPRGSVILPRRSTTSRALVDHHARLANKTRYTRLVEPRTHTPPTKKSLTLPSIKSDQARATELTPPPLSTTITTTTTTDQVFEVVVMRVSLHCQACAGKVKRHLSKMEGVTSFSIDLQSKRVTVMGHVSPLGVLESISKVKRAEFWPS